MCLSVCLFVSKQQIVWQANLGEQILQHQEDYLLFNYVDILQRFNSKHYRHGEANYFCY